MYFSFQLISEEGCRDGSLANVENKAQSVTP